MHRSSILFKSNREYLRVTGVVVIFRFRILFYLLYIFHYYVNETPIGVPPNNKVIIICILGAKNILIITDQQHSII
jgi:hypothetical protein